MGRALEAGGNHLTGWEGMAYGCLMKGFCASGILAVLVVGGCADFNSPITTGEFDPLSSPGSMGNALRSADGYRPGQFVRAIMDNTAFFAKKPGGDAEADKLLPRGTSMKVVMNVDSYLKVELDSGEVGFVPTIMVEDPNAVPQPSSINPNEFQVYPPVQGFEALPTVPPGERPPEGAIPTVVDPNAPAPGGSVPPVDVLPNLPPANGAGAPPPPAAEPATPGQ